MDLLHFFKKFIFWPHHEAYGILVPWPKIESVPPALKAWSLHRGSLGEVPYRTSLDGSCHTSRSTSHPPVSRMPGWRAFCLFCEFFLVRIWLEEKGGKSWKEEKWFSFFETGSLKVLLCLTLKRNFLSWEFYFWVWWGSGSQSGSTRCFGVSELQWQALSGLSFSCI